MEKGKIIKCENGKFPEYIYTIKTFDNKIIKSIEYFSKKYRLKVDDEVEFEIIDGKAKILDSNLIKMYKHSWKDYLLFIIVFIIFILLGISYMFKNKLGQIIFIIAIASLFIKLIVDRIIHFLKGKIEIVEIIDREIVYNGESSYGNSFNMRLTARRKNGEILIGIEGYDSVTEKLNIGDSIKVKIFKNKFFIYDK